MECERFLMSVNATANEHALTTVVLYIDSDDPKLEEYKHILENEKYNGVSVVIGDRKPLGQCWNQMARYTDADILMMGNDDAIFQSIHWDDVLRIWDQKYPDGIYVLYPDDMSGNFRCTFPAVSRTWIDTLGYFVPEIFEFLANDTYIERVGNWIGRIHFLPQIQLEHLHFAFGKSQMDETYAEHRRSGATKRDVNILGMNAERIYQDVNKLKAKMR